MQWLKKVYGDEPVWRNIFVLDIIEDITQEENIEANPVQLKSFLPTSAVVRKLAQIKDYTRG